MAKKSRRERMEIILDQMVDNVPFIEELRDELQEWRDNIPENLSEGNKAEELDEKIEELENVIDDLNNAIQAGREIEFPGMI